MEKERRIKLIKQLDYSFRRLPMWGKTAVKHAMCAPECSPLTGEKYTSFKQVINDADDESLEILKDDFEGNGDLLNIPLDDVLGKGE